MVMIFMRKYPPTPPSAGAESEKLDVLKSFEVIKNDKNLWKFFSAYIILYGTLLSSGSTSNLLLKPYEFKDI